MRPKAPAPGGLGLGPGRAFAPAGCTGGLGCPAALRALSSPTTRLALRYRHPGAPCGVEDRAPFICRGPGVHHVALRVVHREVLHREVHRVVQCTCKMATREMIPKVVH